MKNSGLKRTSTVSVGKTFEEFANPVKKYTPVMINRYLAPISELFIKSYMGKILPPIDYDAIRPWFDGRIANYCEVFKGDRDRCDHVVR